MREVCVKMSPPGGPQQSRPTDAIVGAVGAKISHVDKKRQHEPAGVDMNIPKRLVYFPPPSRAAQNLGSSASKIKYAVWIMLQQRIFLLSLTMC